MFRKVVLIALGVVSGAAMLAISAPSYSEDALLDEYSQQSWRTPADETVADAFDAENIIGVAGRRADEMADEGRAGLNEMANEGRAWPGQSFGEDATGD